MGQIDRYKKEDLDMQMLKMRLIKRILIPTNFRHGLTLDTTLLAAQLT